MKFLNVNSQLFQLILKFKQTFKQPKNGLDTLQ